MAAAFVVAAGPASGDPVAGAALFGGQFASPLMFGPLVDATSIATGALVAAAGTTGILIVLFRLKEPPAAADTAETATTDMDRTAPP